MEKRDCAFQVTTSGEDTPKKMKGLRGFSGSSAARFWGCKGNGAGEGGNSGRPEGEEKTKQHTRMKAKKRPRGPHQKKERASSPRTT
jgi:hypothetical protein